VAAQPGKAAARQGDLLGDEAGGGIVDVGEAPAGAGDGLPGDEVTDDHGGPALSWLEVRPTLTVSNILSKRGVTPGGVAQRPQ